MPLSEVTLIYFPTDDTIESIQRGTGCPCIHFSLLLFMYFLNSLFFTFCLSVSIPKNRQHPIKIIYNNKCPS
ncbi:hypothetical protein P283_L10356 [Saccharomyces cerevisiae P283]|nr:hypothetical protein P283_L10356 [Saccharomyces cerevisiae P283]